MLVHRNGSGSGAQQIRAQHVKHFVTRTKRNKRHSWAENSVHYLKDLEEKGWLLMHEGITIKENKYHCKWCDKGGQAYEAWKKMFDELRTGKVFSAPGTTGGGGGGGSSASSSAPTRTEKILPQLRTYRGTVTAAATAQTGAHCYVDRRFSSAGCLLQL